MLCLFCSVFFTCPKNNWHLLLFFTGSTSKMTKFKGRTTTRGSWTVDAMKAGMDNVLSGAMSVREAAIRFNVPKSSLQDRIACIRQGQECALEPKLGRFTSTFTPNFESMMAEHVKELDDRLMGLSKKEFLKLAFDLAEHLHIEHRFNRTNQSAGNAFYKSFMKRFPQLSLRLPESTSLMRCVGFNKPQVMLFFEKLRFLKEKFAFPPSRMYNADETGISSVHHNPKVLSTKGKKQVGKLTSAERGRNITVMFCMNPTGHFIPPLFIFPRVRMNERLMIGAPDDAIAVAQPNGWMDSHTFLRWLQHFERHVHPSKENPVLLILDGHASHKDLSVLNFAREHNIHMLSTPPHTTHKIQPLDRTFMKSFKGGFYEASALWMRNNSGIRITDYEIAALVSSAYSKTCRLEIARNGFACTGIHPLNAEVFSDLDFLPSKLTEIPEQQSECAGRTEAIETNSTAGTENLTKLPTDIMHRPGPSFTRVSASTKKKETASNVSRPSSTVSATCCGETFAAKPSEIMTSLTVSTSLPEREREATVSTSLPECEGEETSRPTANISSPNSSTTAKETTQCRGLLNSDCSPTNLHDVLTKLSPFPDASKKRQVSRKRKSQKSEILTSTPYKNMVEDNLQSKKRNTVSSRPTILKCKKKLMTSEPDKSTTKQKEPDKSTTKQKPSSSAALEAEDDTECLFCGENFQDNWIQCCSCKGWAHEDCADTDPSDVFYNCDICIKNGCFKSRQ